MVTTFYWEEALSTQVYPTQNKRVCFLLSQKKKTITVLIRQWLADAIDIDNITDYQEMVKKITGISSVVKVFVDMWHVEKLPQGSKPKGAGSSDLDDSQTASDDVMVHVLQAH